MFGFFFLALGKDVGFLFFPDFCELGLFGFFGLAPGKGLGFSCFSLCGFLSRYLSVPSGFLFGGFSLFGFFSLSFSEGLSCLGVTFCLFFCGSGG